MKKYILIYGVGRFAEYTAYLFEKDTSYSVMGYCIEKNYFKEEMKKGLKKPLFVLEDIAQDEKVADFDIFIAVGNNEIRKIIFKKCEDLNFSIANYISSKAVKWDDLKVGKNVFVGEGSVIQPAVEIGDNSFLIGARIGHHSIIGKNALLSGSTIGGNCKIGDSSYLALNATVAQNVTIGEKNIIGMNVAIQKNTTPNSVYSAKAANKKNLTYDQVADRFLK